MAILKRNREGAPGDSDTDSVSDSASEIVIKPKSHRPKENAFTQQKLKAYEPILTPRNVIPIFTLLAVIFVPLGAAMWYGSDRTQEIIIEYQQCANLASMDYFSDIPDRYTDWNFHQPATVTPKWRYTLNETETDQVEQGVCEIQFQIPTEMGSPVFLFYKMKNFYANHRRYVKSFSEDQIKGKRASMSTIKDTVGQNCQPLSHDANGVKYYPCGLIANAIFNDTFTFPIGVNGTDSNYTMTRDGIAWASDRHRFKKTQYNASEVVPPPNWVKKFPNGYTEENMPDISTWWEFQNWMLSPGLSTFSRMLLRNDSLSMQPGLYQVSVGLHFPVLEFNGKKAIFITTSSVIGAKNSFLGVAWIVAGLICLFLTLVFVYIHNMHPRKTGDLSLLSWNREDQGPGVALPLEKEDEDTRSII